MKADRHRRFRGHAETLGIGAMTDARVKGFYARMVKAGRQPALDYRPRLHAPEFVNKGVGLDLRPRPVSGTAAAMSPDGGRDGVVVRCAA